MNGDDEVRKLRTATKGIADYVKWLESELRESRRALESALSSRAGDLPAMGMHTGLTSKLRVMLAEKPLTRTEIHARLDSEHFPYQRRNLGVLLATTFEHIPVPGKRTGGKWGIRPAEAA